MPAILPPMDWIVSLIPEAAADPIAALAKPPAGASIVELRLDRFPGIDVAAAIGACPLPVLATLRSRSEGGEGSEDPTTRAEILGAARHAGAALLDLEIERDVLLVRELGLAPEQTILSWHNPEGTPEEMSDVVCRMMETQSRWIKVVPSAKNVSDLMSVLALHGQFNSGRVRERRLLTFAMEGPGLASRYLAPLLGPPIGFAAWSDESPAAPGQLSITKTEAVIGHLEGPPQRLYGVVGSDVSGSLSPTLHASGYKGLDLPYLMVPISVPDPSELVELFCPQGATPFDRVGLETRGWAVTTPYKKEAAAAADQHAPRVLRAGAANTLILGEQKVMAENTDADGVVGSLVSLGFDPQGHTAVVQGTGGAARGAAVGLHLAGADVFLRGRSAERTRQIAEEMEIGWCEPAESAPGGSILVNATPVGRETGETGVFSEEEVAGAAAVVDMVYGEDTTNLIDRAGSLDLPAADGREVLLHQGIAQFAAFTQRVPPKDAMRAALRRE
ncbi:MAG: type I 3-dehydroquinate dehydratase [Acidobacteria bacterium]|nr:type I 3-dehydroquinate dehydratase [Candidatus Sulfomarinibacter kjeldsenii]